MSSSSRVRTKAPASKWLDAPIPVPVKSHRAPIASWFQGFRAGYSETGSFERNWT